MKKVVAIVLFALTVSACGALGNEDRELHTHEVLHEALELKASISVGDDIKVDASLTNVSGKPIIYNERCGVPFYISAEKDDATVELIHDDMHAGCDDILDPNDLVEMAVNETFEQQTTFKPEIYVANNQTTHAFSGTYNIEFSFPISGDEPFHSSIPVELVVNKEADILTVDEAREAANTDEEVKAWLGHQEEEGRQVSKERAILSDGKWVILYHAVHVDEQAVDRINIQLDAKSGEMVQVRPELLSEEKSEGIVEFIKERALE